MTKQPGNNTCQSDEPVSEEQLTEEQLELFRSIRIIERANPIIEPVGREDKQPGERILLEGEETPSGCHRYRDSDFCDSNRCGSA